MTGQCARRKDYNSQNTRCKYINNQARSFSTYDLLHDINYECEKCFKQFNAFDYSHPDAALKHHKEKCGSRDYSIKMDNTNVNSKVCEKCGLLISEI